MEASLVKLLDLRENGKSRLDVMILWLVNFSARFSRTFSSCTSQRAIPLTFLQLYAMMKKKKGRDTDEAFVESPWRLLQ